MTKRTSEGEFGAALREVDVVGYVLRLPDPKSGAGVSNWKPADFLVWRRYDDDAATLAVSSWFECKDTDQVKVWPFADLRPAQEAGIRSATRVGIPYWLAIYWRKDREWTISDAARVLGWRAEQLAGADDRLGRATSIPRNLLESRFGVSCGKAQLTSTLKQVMLGEAS